MSTQEQLLIVPLRTRVSQLEYSKNSVNRTHIRAARLQQNAGVVGAAFLGLQYTQEDYLG